MTQTEPSRWMAAAPAYALCLLTAVVAALPAIVPDNLLLNDYPEHLAAFFTLEHFQTSADLQRYYAIRDGAFPYWGIRSMMALLTQFFAVETAMRIFAIMALLMPVLGAVILHRAVYGRFSALPFLSLLFVYNTAFAWGLLNFLFSAGIALICFAVWIGSTGWSVPRRVLVLSGSATGIIWLHPFAYIGFGLMVGFCEFSKFFSTPSKQKFTAMVWAALCLLFPALSLILFSDFTSEGPSFILGDLSVHIWAIFTPLWMDHFHANLFVGIVSIIFIIFLIYNKTISFDLILLQAFLGILVVSFIIPVVLFGVFLANIRIPSISIFLFISLLRHVTTNLTKQFSMYTVFILLLGLKLGMSAHILKAGSDEVSEYRNAIQSIPLGTKVLTVFDRSSPSHPGPIKETQFQNISSYLIVDRQAFIPDIFGSVEVTHADEFSDKKAPLWKISPSVEGLLSLSDKPSETERYLSGWRMFYDYLVVFDFGEGSQSIPATELVFRSRQFAILKILKLDD